ncbi:hypothetical protein L7E62_003472 [Vibrio parahaemolyticus]|uniref:hypothetical protein n=1 Tax=Vibrio TaxID=662 RepID=UPI001156E611|nr:MULTISPECIES: hypothetical protein [Vibrio]EIV1736906.1 hypothetical protein [Vibrio parahaemolyticus]EJO4004684.1 hypothetical protein [Vibrio cholerae]MBM4854649.1 hypothetical protein [Vibrio parahaemolyticus]TQQ11378.1 hypothetical protein FLL71_07080 [Vibrio cholerae]WMN97381.1 hypothetical protein NI380_07280 [Vibrio parahaemolyticus]
MTNDIIYAGLFGMLSTLMGAVITYALSFSRDQRIMRQELKVMYSALVADLKAINVGFERSDEYLPRFSSLNVFMIKGGYNLAPSEIVLCLESISYDLSRIEDISKSNHAFNVAVASSGQVGLVYNNRSNLNERAELILRVQEAIPQLVTKLQPHT